MQFYFYRYPVGFQLHYHILGTSCGLYKGSSNSEQFITDWLEENLFLGVFGWKFIRETGSYESALSNEQWKGANKLDLLWMKNNCPHLHQPSFNWLLASFLIQTVEKIRGVFVLMSPSLDQALFTAKFSSPAQLGMQCTFSTKRLKVKVIQLVYFPA